MRLLKKCKTLRAALGGRLARMGRRGRWELSVLLGLALALSLSSFTRFSAACAGVREDTLRLHILANSDSEADQELKLAVRDAILQAEGGMFAAERTKEGALRAAGADLEAIRAVAQRTVRARGYSYPVAVRLENMYFSTREYDGFTLPAGRYDAVRVEIGAHAREKLVLRAVSAHVRSRGNIRRRARTCRLIPVRSSRLCAVLIRSALRLWNGWRG